MRIGKREDQIGTDFCEECRNVYRPVARVGFRETRGKRVGINSALVGSVYDRQYEPVYGLGGRSRRSELVGRVAMR